MPGIPGQKRYHAPDWARFLAEHKAGASAEEIAARYGLRSLTHVEHKLRVLEREAQARFEADPEGEMLKRAVAHFRDIEARHAPDSPQYAAAWARLDKLKRGAGQARKGKRAIAPEPARPREIIEGAYEKLVAAYARLDAATGAFPADEEAEPGGTDRPPAGELDGQ